MLPNCRSVAGKLTEIRDSKHSDAAQNLRYFMDLEIFRKKVKKWIFTGLTPSQFGPCMIQGPAFDVI
jgi:hypothetical protein